MKAKITKPLWHAAYIYLCLSYLCLSAAVYALIPLLIYMPSASATLSSPLAVSGQMLLFGVGIFILGALNAYLLERYFRKRLGLFSAMVLLVLSVLLMLHISPFLWWPVRLVQGMLWGVVHMTLGATLVNDLSQSPNRTRADYYYAWFGRLGGLLGISGALYIAQTWGYRQAVVSLLVIGGVGLLCLCCFRVPFRAPLTQSLFSVDRFWQRSGVPLFLNLLPANIAFALFLVGHMQPMLVLCVLCGAVLALVCERVVFVDSDQRSEIATGGVLLMAASLAAYFNPMHLIAPILMGMGIALINSRFLIYFLKLSGHSHRGTSQHTHFLGCTAGIYLGLAVGLCLGALSTLLIQVVLIVLCVVVYLVYTHQWFLTHRDRDFKFKEV